MTPAVKLLDKAKAKYQLHQYQHDANAESFGLEACEKLNLAPECVFKTLVTESQQGELVVAIVPVHLKLNMKQLAKASKSKSMTMAEAKKVQSTTGYVLGGVSPLGQKKRLSTFIDDSAKQQQTIYVSGGKRGLEIEIAPHTLAKLLNGHFAPLTSS